MRKFLVVASLLALAGCRHQESLTAAPGRKIHQATRPAGEFEKLAGIVFTSKGGIGNNSDMLEVRNGSIRRTSDIYGKNITASLTKTEMAHIRAALYHANFAHIVGNYTQTGVYDDYQEALKLTVGEGIFVDTYRVTNYGDVAPPAYYELTSRLWATWEKKFPNKPRYFRAP